MTEKSEVYDAQTIEPIIFTVRDKKVIMDVELARIYGVQTKVFNQAVKRNKQKFPTDFMFQLTGEEYEDLRPQFTTSSHASNRSQFVTGSQKHRNPRYLPYVFTEHRVVMAANILRGERAIQISVFVCGTGIRSNEADAHLTAKSCTQTCGVGKEAHGKTQCSRDCNHRGVTAYHAFAEPATGA